MRVLVTGGAGYIGSHMVKRLTEAGEHVVVVDDLSTGFRDAIPADTPLVVDDLTNRDRLTDVLRSRRIDAIMHFAGKIAVGESVSEPCAYYTTNVSCALNLMAAAVAAAVERFIFSSSAAVYGHPDVFPISDDEPLAPINPYGRSKAFVEAMLADIAAARGLKALSFRYFNAAGAHPDGTLRERHDPETHLIPIALAVANGARAPLAVFGDDYPTEDGTCVRDYVHVGDICEAHLLGLRWLDDSRGARAFNLGTGRGASVLDVVASVERVTGLPVKTVVAPRRPGDPPRLVANADGAKRELGWEPRYDSLDTIVEHAYRATTR